MDPQAVPEIVSFRLRRRATGKSGDIFRIRYEFIRSFMSRFFFFPNIARVNRFQRIRIQLNRESPAISFSVDDAHRFFDFSRVVLVTRSVLRRNVHHVRVIIRFRGSIFWDLLKRLKPSFDVFHLLFPRKFSPFQYTHEAFILST